MAQTKPKAAQFYGVSDNGTDGQFLKTDGTGGMSWDSPITNPTITSIDYPGTATAADPAGGESVIINGTLFASGITCTVGGTSAVTAFNSATQITITTPAKAAGQYTVAVTNPNGGTVSQANFIQYSGVPVWSTAAGNLGSIQEGDSASFQVTATEGSDTIEYAVTTGTLPTGLSLNTNTGAITGTAPSVSASTTTTFSITATDDENQTSSARSFNITVTPDLPSNHFTPIIWTGDGSSNRLISTVNFQSDFIWAKQRNGTGDHILVDSVRGGTGTGPSATNLNILYPYGNFTESTNVGSNYIPSIENNGFRIGTSSYVNTSGNTYVAWCLKAGGAAVANNVGTQTTQVSANNTLGFSIVSYSTNNDASKTFGHGLDAAPELIITKATNAAVNWAVYNSTLGKTKILELNVSSSQSSVNSGDYWNTSTGVNSTVFGYSYSGTTYDFISYCFTSKPGFSKVGTYTGNTSSPPIVSTGFEPAFLMIKIATGNDSWFMVDNKRETSNPRGDRLFANSTAAETSEPGAQVNFLSNGFQITGSGGGAGQTNSNGETYLYIAFAADPSTTTPSLANSFAAETYTGNSSTNTINTVGFKPDLTWIKGRNYSDFHALFDSVRGVPGNNIASNSTNQQGTNTTTLTSFDTNGFTLGSDATQQVNYNTKTYVAWNWKAGGSIPSINTDGSITSLVSANQAAGFSVVKWTGTRPTVGTLGHGLGLTPEMIIIKNTSITSDWTVYVESEGPTKHGILDTTGAWVSNGGAFNNTSPTSNVFTVGGDAFTNGTGNSIIAYCFTSIAGYSKVGTYVGTGTTTPNINVGFEPGFVMIKGVDNNGNWAILDNKRGGTSRDQLDANDTHAEYANQGVTFNSTGFSPRQSVSSDTNTSGITYLYLAIKEN